MNVNRVLLFKDSGALDRLQNFLAAFWIKNNLTAMLAPVESSEKGCVISQVVEDHNDLAMVNPFAPLLLSNAAGTVREFVADHPKDQLAIVLRPCELRTLVELLKRHRAIYVPQASENEGRVIVIGVDCAGTFPLQEYSRRVAQEGTVSLTEESLAYSTEGLTPAQFRVNCQVCDWPAPRGADIIIGTIGVATQQSLLVIARDERIDARFHLQMSTDRVATEAEVVCRETAVGAVANQRTIQREHMNQMRTWQFGDFCSLLACFARCTLCTDCLDVCPIYDGELEGLLGVKGSRQNQRPALSELVGLSRWLTSCSGCGMCQEACEHGVSLGLLISILSQHIREELHYTCGEPTQSLPWCVS